jgi:catechol 2,3-dioxygenase-like lactoylglutathione lyase family enzyme
MPRSRHVTGRTGRITSEPVLDHVSITVDDLVAAVEFYDATLGALGHARVYRTGSAAGYGQRNSATDDSHSYLSIVAQESITSDDRHWAFRARTRQEVDRFYAAALEAGGRDDGGVALRPEYHPSYYSAFVLDPAGNRIEAVCHRDPTTISL